MAVLERRSRRGTGRRRRPPPGRSRSRAAWPSPPAPGSGGAGVVGRRRLVDQQARRLDPRGDVGEPVRDRLVVLQRLAERLALERAVGRQVERRAAPSRSRTRRRWGGTGRASASRPGSRRRARPSTCSRGDVDASKRSEPIACGASSSLCSPLSPSRVAGDRERGQPARAPSRRCARTPCRCRPRARLRSTASRR